MATADVMKETESPAVEQAPAGVYLRMDPELRRKLKMMAAEAELSQNELAVAILGSCLGYARCTRRKVVTIGPSMVPFFTIDGTSENTFQLTERRL